jgi:putative tricarboxylic transport membrane protein
MPAGRVTRRSLIGSGLAALGCGAGRLTVARAAEADWKPTRPVEVVVGVSPGGSMDRTARAVSEGLREGGFIPNASIVLNKPGGGHAIALAYTASRRGDAGTIQIINTPLLTNNILGRDRHSHHDVTPVATLFLEQQMFAVGKDSSIRDARDLMARFKADPGSISYAVSSGVGTANELAALLLAHTLGVDPKTLNPVSFKSASEAVTMALGSHIDVLITTPFSIIPFIQNKDLRPLAVASENRLGGVLADVPTWRELGADVVTPGFRVVIAPPGLAPAQVAFWERALTTITATPAWQAQVETEFLTPQVAGSAGTVVYLDREYARYAALYRAIGII